jgi:ribosomal protein S18 acetylase RimI-like enzyme
VGVGVGVGVPEAVAGAIGELAPDGFGQVMGERELVIRRALPEDEAAVLALVERLVAFGPPPYRDPQQMVLVDRDLIARAIRATADDPLVLVAAIGNAVAGFVHLHSMTDHYNDRPHGHVSDIVVAPAFEGKGIAQRLLDAARDWALAKGFRWLTISVFEKNSRAAAIYEKAGFKRDILRLVQPLA